MACITKRIEFTFLTSARVRKVVSPTGRTDTFTSHRIDPSSMLPSQVPNARTIARKLRRYSPASSGDFISGLDTISIKPTPARFKSIKVFVGLISWIDFPASCSKCKRSTPIFLVPSEVVISINPSPTIGWYSCVI